MMPCWRAGFINKFNRVRLIISTLLFSAKFVNKSTLPSYPSEAAVLAGVTAEMMKLLFPGESAIFKITVQQERGHYERRRYSS